MIAVVSHDAGGAEYLSSWVRRFAPECVYSLAGPAVKIFSQKIGDFSNLSLAEALMQADTIICSTGWQSDLEFQGIKLGKRLGKKTIALLDHWVNYSDRFKRHNEIILPDEIWVCDKDAKTIAQLEFPETKIELIENAYFLDLKDQMNSLFTSERDLSQDKTVLYVTEPTSTHAMQKFGKADYWGYTEHEALRFFLNHIDLLGSEIKKIVVRPHPSETSEKYEWLKSEFQNLPIKIDNSKSLLEMVVHSDFVVGCNSMAMVVGLHASKKVYSVIPPGGKKGDLPHKEIISFRDIVSGDH